MRFKRIGRPDTMERRETVLKFRISLAEYRQEVKMSMSKEAASLPFHFSPNSEHHIATIAGIILSFYFP